MMDSKDMPGKSDKLEEFFNKQQCLGWLNVQ